MRYAHLSIALTFVVSLIVAVESGRLWPAPSGIVQGLARSCAAAGLVWSIFAAGLRHGRGRTDSKNHPSASSAGSAHVVALLLAVVSVIVLALILAMRVVLVVIDLVTLDTHPGGYGYGFSADGLWPLGFIFLACAVSWFSTGDRRLATCQLLCAIMVAAWVCLLGEPIRATANGGVERTAVTLGLLGTIPLLLVTAVFATTWLDRRECRRATCGSSGALGKAVRPWPALAFSVTVVATGVLMLVCYHLAVPVPVEPGGYRLASLIVAGSAGFAALACFMLLRATFTASLSESAMALTSLGLCGLATVAVPAEPYALSARYPMVFNAMILGLAVAAGLCVWLGVDPHKWPSPWRTHATVVRLAPYARRFAFLNAALGLVLSAAMAIWPRWPAIATMDHTFGRVAAGLSANLALVLVTLWASRLFRRLSFQILILLVLFSTAAFVVIRVLPFSGRFG